MRVSKSALEARWKMSIESGHPILPWMVEYVAVLMNRFEVGRDGRTSFEGCKAKKAKMLGVEFGEAVLWKRRPVGGALGKLTCLWEYGIYIGVKGATGEMIIGTEKGIWRTRTLQRKPIETRWDPGGARMIGWGSVEIER